MLFSKALSLICHHCLPSSSGKCRNLTNCTYQCLTATTAVYLSGNKHIHHIQTCGTPKTCVNRSLNLGIIKVTTNAKCCRHYLCNSQPLSDLPAQAYNGGMCYICDNSNCSETVNCTAHEDRCIIAKGKQGSQTVPMKGCVSKSFCIATGLGMLEINVSKVKCCEGNLCNSVKIIGNFSGNSTESNLSKGATVRALH
ncbi:urokinase plasminogen activator surface receptor-like [Clarias gariepinus]|uniref:urokinase plasminogen activator surface receptor-like n=1 Tax=Clarias gariepinus TaxID=13013 RepID=UPI00234CEDEA|nr:urokinase plasminogen activator surface receptor-like [Clarias gariepinus]